MPVTVTPETPDHTGGANPATKDPTPTAKPVASKADTKKLERELAKRERTVEEFKADLADAQAEVAEAFADVKAVTESGEPVNLTPLMAAIDNLTAAVGNITAHGARNSWLSNDSSKAIRDAHAKLTQAFSDLRTTLEFPSMATDYTLLQTTIDNLATAIDDAKGETPETPAAAKP